MANGNSGALGLVAPKRVVEEVSRDRGCVMVPFLGESHARGTERKLDVAMKSDVRVRQPCCCSLNVFSIMGGFVCMCVLSDFFGFMQSHMKSVMRRISLT